MFRFVLLAGKSTSWNVIFERAQSAQKCWTENYDKDFLDNIRNLPESEAMIKGLGHLNQVEIIMKGLETDNQKTVHRYLCQGFHEENEMLNSSLTQ